VLLAPEIKRDQAKSNDPTYFEHLEWLAGVMVEMRRRAGAPTVDEETLSRALGSRITSLQDTIRVEHALRTVMIASLEAVNVAPPAATAPVSALSAAPVSALSAAPAPAAQS